MDPYFAFFTDFIPNVQAQHYDHFWISNFASVCGCGGYGCRSSLISIEHAELLRSTLSLVLCCAWLVTIALHVHCGLGQLSPLPTSGDDK